MRTLLRVFRLLKVSPIALFLLGTGCAPDQPGAGPSPRQKKITHEDTLGVFRPPQSTFYLENQNSSGFGDLILTFGALGDHPLAGDWDGDGDDTLGVFRNGVFYLKTSNEQDPPNPTSNPPSQMIVTFASPGDQPLVGDWDGDGIDTIGSYRDGNFFLRNSNVSGQAEISFSFGMAGDIAVAGDWDGDGRVNIGVFRPSNGTFYLRDSNANGPADRTATYGSAGDTPIIGDWDGDGVDTIGIYRRGVFHLRNSNTSGLADLVIGFGIDGDFPVAGDWDGLP